jgi:hypothetical protein
LMTMLLGAALERKELGRFQHLDQMHQMHSSLWHQTEMRLCARKNI